MKNNLVQILGLPLRPPPFLEVSVAEVVLLTSVGSWHPISTLSLKKSSLNNPEVEKETRGHIYFQLFIYKNARLSLLDIRGFVGLR